MKKLLVFICAFFALVPSASARLQASSQRETPKNASIVESPTQTVVPDDTQAVKRPAPPAAADVEQLRKELIQAKREAAEAAEALGIARAARADCEITLGPIEVQARRTDIQRRWTELKALMEKYRPGYDCDPHTGECTKKPDAQKAPGGAR